MKTTDKERAGSVFFVPVPSSWFGKSRNEDMTFDEALKALNSDEHKKAVALMKQIDRQLGIKAELSSGINDSPNDACVVIVHNIKTPLSSEKLRYIAVVKGKALMEKSPDQSSAGYRLASGLIIRCDNDFNEKATFATRSF